MDIGQGSEADTAREKAEIFTSNVTGVLSVEDCLLSLCLLIWPLGLSFFCLVGCSKGITCLQNDVICILLNYFISRHIFICDFMFVF